jgi:uncharacterized protein (TIGR00369 family)
MSSLSPEWAAAIRRRPEEAPYARLLGLRYEEVRPDYARMRLPFRTELLQAEGVVHGGAIASLIDTVVVAAVLSGLEEKPRRLSTVELHVHFLEPARHEDLVAEARVRRRGKRLVFLEVDVRAESGTTVAHGELVYAVSL